MSITNPPVGTEDCVIKAVAATYATTPLGASLCCVDSARDDPREPVLRALYACALFAADGAARQPNPHAPSVWEDIFGRVDELVLTESQAVQGSPKKVALNDFSARWLPGWPGGANPPDADWPLRLAIGSLTVAALPSRTEGYCTTLLRLAVAGADEAPEGSLDLTAVRVWPDGAGGQRVACQVDRYAGRLTSTSRKLRRQGWRDFERQYTTAARIEALKKAPNFHQRSATTTARGGTR
jgi:hypothetical protein